MLKTLSQLESDIKKQFNLVSFNNLSEFQWEKIATYKLSEEFIIKYQDKLDWFNIESEQVLSEDFMEKYQDKLDWDNVSCYQKLSESMLEKHKDEINWSDISATQILSEPFIEKYQDKLDWSHISYNQQMSNNFIIKHIDKITELILKNKKIKLSDEIKTIIKLRED